MSYGLLVKDSQPRRVSPTLTGCRDVALPASQISALHPCHTAMADIDSSIVTVALAHVML